jgi:cytochrome P450
MDTVQETTARDPFRYLMKLATERPVARYRAGAEQAYLVSDPELIKHVLADNASNYTKDTAVNRVFKNAVADGLLTSEGTFWRHQRKLMQPAFRRERLSVLGSLVTETTEAMLARWKALADTDQVVEVSEEMSALTMQTTAKALFGADISGEVEEIGRKIAAALTILVSPGRAEFQQASEQLDSLVASIVDERMRTPSGSVDLLAMLMEAKDEAGEGMPRRQLLDEIITLLLAGYETTANSLGWTWYLLSRNPKALQRMESEVDSVLSGRVPTTDDLVLLPETRRVLEESLRLYPPAWILGRRALGADRLGDVDIAAGSVIAMSPYIVHRLERYWPDPESFQPDRFLTERMPGKHPFAYFPFGGGPRLCIGHNFAMLEAHLIVATIAQRYRLRLVPGHAVEPERLFVLRPRGGLPMTIHSR